MERTRSRWISSKRFSASVLRRPPLPEPEPEADEPVASSLGLEEDFDFFFLRGREEGEGQGGQRCQGARRECLAAARDRRAGAQADALLEAEAALELERPARDVLVVLRGRHPGGGMGVGRASEGGQLALDSPAAEAVGVPVWAFSGVDG